jgi:5'(3')-deoxyribonucleotidase
MRTFRVNIDSDDVVYDLSAELLPRANRRWDKDLETFPMWGFGEAYGVSKEEVSDFFEQETKKGLYGYGGQIPGAISAIKTLAEAGHDLRIVTHKHGMGKHKSLGMKDLIDWYDYHGLLDLVDIVFARGDKTQYPADIVIDDKPTLAWTQEGALNVLFLQPWNESVKGSWADPLPQPIFRANGWDQVLQGIELWRGKGI